MDPLRDIPLNTDLESAAALIGQDERRRAPKFTIPHNLAHVRKAKLKSERRDIKRFIRPENARFIIDHLPLGDGDRTHCVLRGDFVLCDLIPLIIEDRGRCDHLRIATLGMSAGNADTLARLVESGRVGKLTIVVSHYFQQVDKTTTFHQVSTRLRDRARLVITRSHAKVILLPTKRGDHFSIEGSANLRSSDNLEQMAIVNDAETHDFHAGWIDQLASAA